MMPPWSTIRTVWMYDDPRSRGARAILRGAAAGLRANGKTVREFELDPNRPDAGGAMRKDLLETRPDAVFLANHPSSLFLKQTGLKSLPVPSLVWLLDDPFMMGDEPFLERDIALAADPQFIEPARKRGAKTVFFLPVAAPEDTKADPRAEFRCPVAYVGSIARMKQAREGMTEAMAARLDAVIEAKLRNPDTSFQTLLEAEGGEERGRIRWTGPLAYYLYTEANRLSRLRYLTRMAPFGLRLYGTEAWREEIAGTPLEDRFRGPLDPFGEHPALIRSARINIALRSQQDFMAPTQRDFLVPALGGFLLATRSKGQWMDWSAHDPGGAFGLDRFHWPPRIERLELTEEALCRHLNEPVLMDEWIEKARARILERHTFAHRMEQLGRLWDGAAGQG